MNTETATRNTWAIYEEPRNGAEHTTALFEWSRNYSYPTPATLFLGLIGYEDMEGVAQGVALGYMELDYLGDALKEYANNPQLVNEAIAEILEAESKE
jgi:hypothetical protein